MQGAAFFEQLRWLVREELSTTAPPAWIASLAAAISRLWDSDNPVWRRVYNDVGEPSQLRPERRDAASRLAFVLSTISVMPALTPALGESLHGFVSDLAEAWTLGVGDISTVISVVKAAMAADIPTGELVEAARDFLWGEARYSYPWTLLGDLLAIAPEAFPVEILAQLRQEFGDWAERVLDEELDDVRDVEELMDISSAAEALGVKIDEEVYDSAYGDVSQRPVPEDHYDYHDEDWRGSSAESSDSESASIDRLFGRLDDA